MREITEQPIPYEAYLSLSQHSDAKYEYHDGYVTAMAGGSPEHGQITTNTGRAIGNALEAQQKECIVYSSDVRVRIEQSNRTFYPDLSVVCDALKKSEKDPSALLNPILIIEVLSDSTANFDRGNKFAHYRKIPSLQEYVLISQHEAIVDAYFQAQAGLWEIQTVIGMAEKVLLKSIPCEIAMADLYRLVPGFE